MSFFERLVPMNSFERSLLIAVFGAAPWVVGWMDNPAIMWAEFNFWKLPRNWSYV